MSNSMYGISMYAHRVAYERTHRAIPFTPAPGSVPGPSPLDLVLAGYGGLDVVGVIKASVPRGREERDHRGKAVLR
jgi:hypothetical protein